MAEKIFPQKARFYLADDVRTELGGKPTIVGLYPDDRITLGLLVGTSAEAPTMPITFEGFSVLVSFDRGQGDLDATLKLTAPNGQVLINDQKLQVKAKKLGQVHFVARFKPFTTPDFGKHTLSLDLEGTIFEFEFELVYSLETVSDELDEGKASHG